MALLTVQQVGQSGLAPVFVAAGASGDTFANNGRTYLHVKNASASAITVTIDSVALCNYGFDHNLTVSVPAAGERIIGTFEPNRFNNDTSLTSVTYSAATSVTVAAITL